MITIRGSQERGKANFDWLDSRHSFSFGNYYDDQHMGFRTLRVINEDFIKAGAGFPAHGHRDMEIITYVLKGAVQHQDSLGNHTIIKRGEIQCMTAGTGIVHSEFNPSQTETLHMLQIWIFPEKQGLKPSYQQESIDLAKVENNLYLLVSGTGENGSILIHQDLNLYVSQLSPQEKISYEIKPKRNVWLQVANGDLIVNDISLTTGDGAAIIEEKELVIKALRPAEFLLFDLN